MVSVSWVLLLIWFLIKTSYASTSQSIEEDGNYFEGDILYYPGQDSEMLRNLVGKEYMLWPNRTLYYEITDEFSYFEKLTLMEAIDDLKAHTCVRFENRPANVSTYVRIRNIRNGCASVVGYLPIGRPIDMFLPFPNCDSRGTIQHEFLHSLGFWHEHTRPDRDQYVTINWENIRKGFEINFVARDSIEVQTLGMPYDFDSVMHYRSIAFSKDGLSQTIVTKDSRHLWNIGQRIRFSPLDMAKLNRLYGCFK